MSLSGIKVTQEVIEAVKDYKLNSNKCPYLVVKISDDLKEFVIDDDFKPEKKPDFDDDDAEKIRYDQFREALRSTAKPRFVYYEFRTKTGDLRKIEKIAMIFWSLDGYKIKEKMLYSSSKNILVAAAPLGSGMSIEIHEPDDWPYGDILDLLKKS